MKAIFIDAENREIREVEYKTFEEMKKILKIQWAEVAFKTSKQHLCYIDEEGLLNRPQYFFIHDDGHQPYAGNGMIVGSNNHGDDRDCKLTLEEIKSKVHFLSLEQVQEAIRQGVVNYGTYITPLDANCQPIHEKTECLHRETLGAFDNERN